MLVLGQARRFSVDVDLVTQSELAATEAALTQVCAQPPFRLFAYAATRRHKDEATTACSMIRPWTSSCWPSDRSGPSPVKGTTLSISPKQHYKAITLRQEFIYNRTP